MIIQVPKYLLSRPWLLVKMNLWDPTDPPNLLFYRVDPSNWVAHFPIQGIMLTKNKQTHKPQPSIENSLGYTQSILQFLRLKT